MFMIDKTCAYGAYLIPVIRSTSNIVGIECCYRKIELVPLIKESRWL